MLLNLLFVGIVIYVMSLKVRNEFKIKFKARKRTKPQHVRCPQIFCTVNTTFALNMCALIAQVKTEL